MLKWMGFWFTPSYYHCHCFPLLPVHLHVYHLSIERHRIFQHLVISYPRTRVWKLNASTSCAESDFSTMLLATPLLLPPWGVNQVLMRSFLATIILGAGYHYNGRERSRCVLPCLLEGWSNITNQPFFVPSCLTHHHARNTNAEWLGILF